MISMGYAKQFIEDSTEYTFEETTSGDRTTVRGDLSKQRVDSVFGTFALQLILSQGMALKGSIHTVFPAFEFSKAKDDLKYMVGLSIVF